MRSSVCNAPSEMLKFKQQMASASWERRSRFRSHFFFMEVNDLEIEEELSTMSGWENVEKSS